jgi:hypothetical protein
MGIPCGFDRTSYFCFHCAKAIRLRAAFTKQHIISLDGEIRMLNKNKMMMMTAPRHRKALADL